MAELTHGETMSMADLKKAGIEPQGVYVEDAQEMEDPFGDSKTFAVTRTDLNLPQLQDEIGAAAGYNVQLMLLMPTGDVTEDNPATLYVSPGRIDGRTVQGKLKGHDPDPYYGMTEEQKERALIVEKIRRGEVLTPEEMTLALQSMLRGR